MSEARKLSEEVKLERREEWKKRRKIRLDRKGETDDGQENGMENIGRWKEGYRREERGINA